MSADSCHYGNSSKNFEPCSEHRSINSNFNDDFWFWSFKWLAYLFRQRMKFLLFLLFVAGESLTWTTMNIEISCYCVVYQYMICWCIMSANIIRNVISFEMLKSGVMMILTAITTLLYYPNHEIAYYHQVLEPEWIDPIRIVWEMFNRMWIDLMYLNN